jgi:DNA polymerase III subunit alpha
MPEAEFVHLHVHSEFSMLDGALRIGDLVEHAKSVGAPAIALTDSGNMHGAVQLHKACKGAGVEAILGCEVALVSGERGDKTQRDPHHIVLLAASQDGYQNLVRVVSQAWVDGMVDGVPRADFDLLAANKTGLVALTACMGGYVPQAILEKGPEAGKLALGRLRDVFDPGHLFVELEDHGFPENRPLNEVLIELAGEMELPLVATNCAHFLHPDAARAQLALKCIGAGRSLREMEATHHKSAEMYLKTPAQMAELFRHVPGAVKNTLLVAEMCAGRASPLSPPKLPRFPLPAGQTEEGFLVALAREGLASRITEFGLIGKSVAEDEYRARLESELEIIVSMGFAGYFLIVQDFINWAKQNGIPVGPGRGSGAGSLVAYCLRITNLDPIPYGLLFERFLNPERVSMPDFDIDFCMDKRERVIDYVRAKYGHESVGQIATFHQLKSRSVVRDVGRVMGMAPQDAGRIASLIPEPIGGKIIPIGKALEEEPRFKLLYDQDEAVREVVDTAQKIENLTRHAGMHAAGVVMAEGPIWDHVPVFCPEPGVYVTQYHKDDVEAAGLVKFDFLGLKTLTVLDIATKLIDRRPDREGKPIDLDALPLDDVATYALLQSGETTNVFQLESTGMQQFFKHMKPDCFEDIVAAVALYRPGPMGADMHNDFAECKRGRKKVTYLDPSLEHVLRPTLGAIVYQEQVMQIAREMGGLTLGGADLLRRAMGKKKASEMEKQKALFVEGATAKGHSEPKAVEIFDTMAHFAGYGFNKSHSAAYALITYQTAYLKAHFPVEFACATLSADKEKIEKVVRTVAEARQMGITVLPPDVNESEVDFTVVYAPEEGKGLRLPKDRPVCQKGKVHDPSMPKIRFGLGAIKGVGSSALEAVFEERGTAAAAEQGETKKPFADLFDFCLRVDLRRVNKGVCEALVSCGAFDTLHAAASVNRAQAFGAIEQAIELGKRESAERTSGQTNLFGLFGADEAEAIARPTGTFPKVDPWDSREQLAREKTSLGFYVSGHPLDRYAAELRRFCTTTTETVGEALGNFQITLGGVVEGYRERRTKTGGTMAFFHLEDAHGRVEVIVRPREIDTPGVREALSSGDPVLITGKVKHEYNRDADDDAEAEAKLVLDKVELLSGALSRKTKSVQVSLSFEEASKDTLRSLRAALERHPGGCPVALVLASPGAPRVHFGDVGLHVDPSDALLASLERLFGRKVCELH